MFDAEVYAIYRVMLHLDERKERGARHTVFSGSTAALQRDMTDRLGPRQALARAIIRTYESLQERGCSVDLRWTPAHKGVIGDEVAGGCAKAGAESTAYACSREYLAEASASYLARRATERRSQAIRDWISSHVGPERRYRPPAGGKIRPELRKERKELASRYYQLQSGHTAIGTYLRRIRKTDTDKCWWCHSGKRQSRHHLFFRCRRWASEGRKMWREVGKACEWKHPRAPSARTLFRESRATPAVLGFLRQTRVGGMVSLTVVEERDRGEEEMEEIELRPEEGENGWTNREEDGPGPP